MTKIIVENTEIRVMQQGAEDFISLTDMVRSQMQEHIIFRWLSLKSTIEYLGEWEMLYNPKFNCIEFGTIRNEAGKNNFILSVKNWIERTGLTAAQKSFVYADETDLQSKIYTIRGTEQLNEIICRFLHDPADVRPLNVKPFSFYAESVFYSEKVGAKLFHVIVSVIVFGDKAAGCCDVDQPLCFAQAFRDPRFIIDKSQSVHAYRFDIAF